MGYNRTVCMLSVTSADICPNSHLGVNGAMGLRSLGGCLIFVVYVAVSLGLEGVRMRKQIKQDGQRMEWLRLMGALTGSILPWLPPRPSTIT